ncbi:hypothetical protein Tco_0907659 [Tanacetum coccineum]|uniref:Uncharacterized protein n=1 Tax=Tanacetum coccineum TaxID=301880 RepID=A0ABQ5CRD4_9ASTR
MASTKASISKPSKRPKINIIPPKQLFVDLTQDGTKTSSPKHQLSSPSAPNAPSKTPSAKDTSSSSVDYIPKSPTSSTSPSTNGYLNSRMSPPLRVPPPPPTQNSISMDITLTLLLITPLDVQFNTPSPSPPIFGHPIPLNLLEAHGDSYSSRTVEAGLYSSCYELPSITFSFDLNYANLPLIHLEFEELELDRRELDKQELRLLERHILGYYLDKHCRSAESLVGMSTTASTQISSNPLLDRSRSGRLIFLSWSKAFHIFFKLRISEEIPGVEVLALTLATTGLLRELRTLDLLSMILRQSRGILSKKLPPAAEFNES